MTDEIFLDGVRLISAADAAELSSMTREHIARLCRESRVRGRRIGKGWYVEEQSLQGFLALQEFNKIRRQQELARIRDVEYRRSQLPVLSGAPIALEPVSAGAFTLFFQKTTAVVIAGALTIGTYSLVDPLRATSALQGFKSFAAYIINTGDEGFSANARAQFAVAAQDRGVLFGIRKGFENFARRFNTAVDGVVYSAAFPESLTRSPGSVAAGVASLGAAAQRESISASTKQQVTALVYAEPASSPIINNYPVLERVVETERILTVGGISEAILADRLQQLDNKLTSQLHSITAAQSTVIAGNYNVTAQSNRINNLGDVAITGATIRSSSFEGTSGTFSQSMTVGGNLTVNTDLTVLGTTTLLNMNITNSTSTNLFITNASSTNATSTYLFASNLNATNSTSTNHYSSALIAGNSTSTNLYVSGVLDLGTTTLKNLTVSNVSTSTFAGGLTIGTSQLVVQQSTGNVGIGTTTPTNKLEVQGGAFFGGNIIGTSTLALTGTSGTTTIASGQGFTIGSSQFVLQQGSGNVGIGTDAPNALNKLEVKGDASTAVRVAINNTSATGGVALQLDADGASSDSFIDYISGSDRWAVGIDGVSNKFGIALNTGGSGAPLGTSDFFTILNTGLVGIGTTTPGVKFTVGGDAFIGGNITATGTVAIEGLSTLAGFLSTASSTITSGIFTASGGASTTNLTASGIGYFGSGRFTDTSGTTTIASGQGFTIGSSQFVLQQGSGNVGIGTAAPAFPLEVEGSGSAIFRVAVNNTHTSGSVALQLDADSTVTDSFIDHIVGTNRWAVGLDGAANKWGIALNAAGSGQPLGVNNFLTVLSTGHTGIGTTTPWGMLSASSTSATVPAILAEQKSTGPSALFLGGNVGIGTTSPSSKLTVDGGDIDVIDGGGNPFVRIGDTVEDNIVARWNSSSNYGEIWTQQAGAPAGNLILQTTAGNVGLGTVAPTANLHVVGTSGQYTISATSTASAGNSYGLLIAAGGNSSDYSMRVRARDNNTEYFAIRGDGNVGIGTTTPDKKLTVLGEAHIGDVAGNGLFFRGASTAAHYNWMIGEQVNVSTALEFTPSTAVGGSTFTTPAMVILQSGNVGIGTTSPARLLHVTSATEGTPSIVIDNETSAARKTARFVIASSTVEQWAIGNDNILGSGERKFSIADVTQTAHRLVIDSAGNVGIGTTTPDTKFSVNGTTKLGNGPWPTATWGNSNERVGIFASSETAYLILGDMRATAAANQGSEISLGARHTTGSYDWVGAAIGGYKESASGSGGGYLRLDTYDSGGTVTEKMRITSAGNVGIGTTSPTVSRLYVTGDSSNKPLTLDTTGTSGSSISFRKLATQYAAVGMTGALEGNTTTDLGLFAETGANIRFYTNGSATEKMRITSAGNVGIGTSSPLTTVHIAGASTIPSSQVGSLTVTTGNPNAQLGLGVNTTGTMYSWIQSTESGVAFRALALNAQGGSVGIGTTSPSTLLHINGGTGALPSLGGTDVLIQDNDGASDAAMLAIIGGATGNSQILFGDANDVNPGQIDYDHTSNFMAFRTNGGERFRIDSSGNVGIGTTTPVELLSVQGTGVKFGVGYVGDRMNRLFLGAELNGGTIAETNVGTIGYGPTVTGGSGRAIAFGAYTGSAWTEVMRLMSSGNVGIGTTTPTAKLNVVGVSAGSSGLFVSAGASYPAALGSLAEIQLGDTSTYNSGLALLHVKNTGNRGTVGHASGSDLLRLDFSDATALIVNKGGNVGIGTNDPDGGKLDIVGTASALTTLLALTTSNDGSNDDEIAIDFRTNIGLDSSERVSARITSGQTSVSSSHYGDLRFYTMSATTLSETMRLDSAGKLGIGTTTPAETLSVFTANGTESSISINQTSRGQFKWYIPADGYNLRLKNIRSGAETEIIHFQGEGATNGFIGIGTTSPRDKLEVKGGLVLERDSTSQTSWIEDYGGLVLSSQNDLVLVTGSTATVGSFDSAKERLRVLSTGNVGIGTTTPQSLISWVRTLDISGTNSALALHQTANAQEAIVAAGTGMYLDIAGHSTASNNFIAFRTEDAASAYTPTERMRIDSSGNVGIGTTTPFLASTLASGSIGAFNGAICADNGGTTKCYGALTAGTVYGDASSFAASDVAEKYATNDVTLEPGEIVALDTSSSSTVKRAQKGDPPFGVISTLPGVLLGDETGNGVAVALAGRVPVKVSLEGGPITIGDELSVSTTTPGVARKARDGERTIGYALENYTTKLPEGKIVFFVTHGSKAGLTIAELADVLAENEAIEEGSTADTFLKNIFARITKWFADAQNGIGEVFAKTFRAKEEICVDDQCLTKDDVKALIALARAQTVAGGTSEMSSQSSEMTSQSVEPTPGQSGEPSEVSQENSTGAPVEEPGAESTETPAEPESSEAESAPEETPSPEPTPEPAPAPVPAEESAPAESAPQETASPAPDSTGSPQAAAEEPTASASPQP